MNAIYSRNAASSTWRPTESEAAQYAHHQTVLQNAPRRSVSTGTVNGQLVRWLCQVRHEIPQERFVCSAFKGLSNFELELVDHWLKRMPRGWWAENPTWWFPSKKVAGARVIELGIYIDEEKTLALLELEEQFEDTGDFMSLEVPC